MCIHDAAHKKVDTEVLFETIRDNVETVPLRERERGRREPEVAEDREFSTSPRGQRTFVVESEQKLWMTH
jgi:hypothetical protein